VTDDGTLTQWWNFDGFTVAPGFSGDGYYSGSGDNLDHVVVMTQPLAVEAGDTLALMIDYSIETYWDFGYVEVSTDGGASWASIGGNVTTDFDPFGNNLGNGITGFSEGFVPGTFPLDDFAGQTIQVRLRYITDGSVVENGFTVDNVSPVAACAELETIASALPDTTLDVTPDAPGIFRYRVRGIDAEGQYSRWSNPRDHEVDALTGADEPVRFRTQMGSNYPNPFNPTTRIPYVVGGEVSSGSVAVTLRIYSVTGALVTTLVNDTRAPGTYNSVWNGTNDAGQSVVSGIYFAKLTVGADAARTRKLVLLK
jgi:hypothetical protein